MINRENYRSLTHVVKWMMPLALVLLVQWLWGWHSILAPWLDLTLSQVITGIVLIGISYVLRAWRLYDYFRPISRWSGCIRLILLHNFLNNLLPARTGEFSFPLLMKRYFGVPFTRSSPALIWFRVLDLHTLVCISMAVFVLSELAAGWLWFFLLLVLPLPLLIFTVRDYLNKRLTEGLSEQANGRHWRSLVQEALDGLPIGSRQVFSSWILTWLNWLVKLLVLVWFLAQFAELPWYYLLVALVGGELTSVLPIHAPGGIGTYEAGIMAVLLPLLDAHTATLAAINVHLVVLGSSALGALAGWLLIRPVRITETAIPD